MQFHSAHHIISARHTAPHRVYIDALPRAVKVHVDEHPNEFFEDQVEQEEEEEEQEFEATTTKQQHRHYTAVAWQEVDTEYHGDVDEEDGEEDEGDEGEEEEEEEEREACVVGGEGSGIGSGVFVRAMWEPGARN